jgi:hypothetical protein
MRRIEKTYNVEVVESIPSDCKVVVINNKALNGVIWKMIALSIFLIGISLI